MNLYTRVIISDHRIKSMLNQMCNVTCPPPLSHSEHGTRICHLSVYVSAGHSSFYFIKPYIIYYTMTRTNAVYTNDARDMSAQVLWASQDNRRKKHSYSISRLVGRRKVLTMAKTSTNASRKPLVVGLTYDRLRNTLRNIYEHYNNCSIRTFLALKNLRTS